MPDLAAFLSEASACPMEWGRCDCSLMVADWIAYRCGIDPVPDLRGAYTDEQGALSKIEAAGGLVALFTRRLAPLGLAETGAPKSGDIGVLTFRDREFGAIRATSGWAVKTARGVIVATAFRPLRCWTV